MNEVEEAILTKTFEGGKMRIVLRWRGNMYVFGTLELVNDGSLMYAHEALNRPEIERNMTLGMLEQEGSVLRPSDRIEKVNHLNEHGTHVSIHPRKDENDIGVFHLRSYVDGKSKTIVRKKINWEPVLLPFTCIYSSISSSN